MIELLAENNFGDTRSGGLAGPTGLVVILFLAVGTVLLIRSMNKRLRRLPERFEEGVAARKAANQPPPSQPVATSAPPAAPVSPAVPVSPAGPGDEETK